MHKEQYKKSLLLLFLLLLSGFAYCVLAYQTLRENFLQVISLFSVLFAVYYFFWKYFSISYFKYLLIGGITFRLLLLFSVPNLSDDVYRFIWDGRLAANGINPFSYLPADIIRLQPIAGITQELYTLLNSKNYFTIYPPVLQGIFWSAAKLFPVNVFAAIVYMKCVILLADIASIFLLIVILKKLNLPKRLSLLYAVNPLVITELTGNVHFESVMIVFVLLSLLLLLIYKWKTSAICLGLGIATKLVPVLLIPVLINHLGWKKGLYYLFISGVTTVALFAAILDAGLVKHLMSSIDLFFRHFEFNASIYYIVRWIGSLIKGYNVIAFAGPFLAAIATTMFVTISFFYNRNNKGAFFTKVLFVTCIWYMFSTTVHPWYICLPVALAVFTPYRFAFIWSFTATLSYATYQYNPVRENMALIAIGYVVMYGLLWWEIRINKIKTLMEA